MLLSKYISGTIFIDDKYTDVENLIKYFENYNIWSKFINPDNFDGKANYNYAGTRLVFLDLQYTLSGGAEVLRAVNILRDLSESGVKNFILVVWSMHNDEIQELTRCINEKMNDDKPLLILDAKKEECINISLEEFNDKMDKLFKKNIEDNLLIYRLLEWEKNTVFASRDSINDIISLSYDNVNNKFDLEKVMVAMAKASENDTNIKSAFPYLHDILSDNIIKYSEKIDNQLLRDMDSDEELELKLNTLQMISKDDISNIRPGDVYKLDLDDDSKKRLIRDLSSKFDFNTIILPKQVTSIQVDITPPCTFQKDDKSIMLSGIIIEEYNNEIKKKLKSSRENLSINYYYDKEKEKKNILILDFIKTNYINKEAIKFDKIFRLKKEFRSSIQQQFGCFLTRIGNNIIHIK